MTVRRYELYKNSDAQWLGDLPNHWETKRLRRLFEIKKRIVGTLGFDVLSVTQQGLKIKDTESNDGQISLDYSKYQLVEPGDFAMNHMDLLTGYVDISQTRGVTSPDYRVFSIRNKKECYDRYYLYLLQTCYKSKIFYALGQGASQLGRWRLPTNQFQEFVFPQPPTQEQKQIADFLDNETAKIDTLVAEQQRLVELLKEKRQAVISHTVTKGLNHNAPMKNSGVEWLEEVPRTWSIKALRRVISIPLSNGVFKKKDEFGVGVRLINVFDIYRHDFLVNLETLDRVACSDAEIAAYQVVPGDLFFVRSSLKAEGIATVALAGPAQEAVVFECHLVRARPNADVLHPRYASYLLNSTHYRSMMIAKAKITTMTTVDQEAILSLPMLIPDLSEQSAIAAFLDNVTAKIDALIAEANASITLLQERRSVLIYAAVTGKIDVRQLGPVGVETA